MASFGLLEPTDEDALHAARLLNQEEKLFKRINKRLLAPDSLISAAKAQRQAATPPPEGNDETEGEAQKQERERIRRQWRDEAILDFAAFESNIVRAQFLLHSNEQERKRYAAEKIKILETAANVRESNASLHEQLKDAQQRLETRKTYDRLAEKITSNRALRPREDQHAQLDKLNAEIAELERESEEYAKTWAERREQFNRIVEEGRQMLRLIRDEKEEAERKEGMEDMDEGEETEHNSVKANNASAVGTPRPIEEGATPIPGDASQGGDFPSSQPGTAKDKALSALASGPGSRAQSPAAGDLRSSERPGLQANQKIADEEQIANRDTHFADEGGEEEEEGEDDDEEGEVEEGETRESKGLETEKMDTT